MSHLTTEIVSSMVVINQGVPVEVKDSHPFYIIFFLSATLGLGSFKIFRQQDLNSELEGLQWNSLRIFVNLPQQIIKKFYIRSTEIVVVLQGFVQATARSRCCFAGTK